MGITIIHLEGPLAGKEQHFDDSVEAILFGRDREEALVVYPPEYNVVGRKHCQLRRNEVGDYTVELFGDRYVEIDGVPADNGARVKSGSVVRLGSGHGPSFRVLEIEGGRVQLHASFGDLQSMESLPMESMPDPSRNLLYKRRLGAAVPMGLTAELAVTHGHTAPHRPSVFASRGEGILPETPPGVKYRQLPPDRHRGGAYWWAALAAMAAAALAYLLLRRGVLIEGALGTLVHATLPSAATLQLANSDLVDVSVFGPKEFTSDGEALIQVLLHQLDQAEIASAMAKEVDPEATRRGIQTLAAEITRGQRVEIVLEGRGLKIDEEMQALIWRGRPCACQFTVTAPKDLIGHVFNPRLLLLVDSVPVGSITFALKVTGRPSKLSDVDLRGDRARRYTYAFLSYASPDRAEVIKRAQGLKAGGTDFFNDLLFLEPGERWEERLYQEIDRCNVFYLFWSSEAKASEWVMKETEYALARRAASEDSDPDIIPIIIEGPPPPPPEALKGVHFSDSLIYVLAGIEVHAAKTSGHH